MELSDKEVVQMLIGYYSTFDELDILTQKVKDGEHELKEIFDSLTLSSQRISDMPKGHNTSSTVENILEEYIKIQTIYEGRIKDIRAELEDVTLKQKNLKIWISKANLTDTEAKLLELMYREGLKAWKIGVKLGYEKSNVWRMRKRAINKLRNMV